MRNNKMENKRIAIQGIKGAFHEIAARSYFEDHVEIQPASTFEDLISFVEQGEKADIGIMAIENTIAGSLLNNYRLLNDSSLKITGEIFLRIRHQLLVLPGESIADIREVHSHPMAIAQCKQFFKNYPKIRLVESLDTAMSAETIVAKKIKGQAAIASRLAASNFGLQIVAENIETNKENYTRFLILERDVQPLKIKNFQKVSLALVAKHEVGSLAKVLGVLENFQANLTKIQSTPIIGKAFQYCFFIDFTIPVSSQLEVMLQVLENYTDEVNLLGTYKTGSYHES